MKKLLLALILSTSPFVYGDEYLIQEMEALKATLEKNDPDRIELSLRLADLYFDVSIQEDSSGDIIANRKKAMKLYEDVLYGRDGLKAVEGIHAIKIKFQIARVAGKLNEIAKAKKYYNEVFTSEIASKKFKRESALALAEFYEEDVNFVQADKFYKHGIELCESLETCNYAHYKRAWLFYKEVRLDEAIEELKLSLWDSKGQARDKVINDLLLFFSAAPTDGLKELTFIKDLAQKTNQPDLVRKLVEGFYGAGNRIAGSNVLVEWNKQTPALFYETRLLEEFYGFRNWEQVRIYLSAVEKRTQSDLPLDKEEAQDLKEMFKRIIVQLDSDVQQDKTYAPELLRTIDIYLGFYPNDDMRKKLQQGWLKAQEDTKAEIARLKVWIGEDQTFGFDASEIRKLRQTRLSLAQKENMSEVVMEEALALSQILKGEEAREFSYVYAHENYKNKNYDVALPLFLELAKIPADTNIADKWAIQSQNLALDIYNTKKDYKALAAQAALWTTGELAANPKLKNEIKEMQLAQTQAQFEYTASLGQTTEALEQFYNFCFNKVFEDKSCTNAKVLAVKLKDQPRLIALLEKEKDEKALMVEYELMGRFSDAAILNEKFNLTKNADIEAYFKVALLFELDQNFKERDRILNKLVSKIKKEGKIDPKWEAALYITLKEANLINTETLSLKWSLPNKLKIANAIAGEKPNKATDQVLTAGTAYTGPYWSKKVLSDLMQLNQKQAKISFYGNRSQILFKRRVTALDNLKTNALKYLEGADVVTRIYILDILKKAYLNLSTEIMSTPIPEGLTEDILTQVQGQLTALATPYSKVSEDYTRLQNEQLATLKPEEKLAFETKLEDFELDYASFIDIPREERKDLANLDFTDFMDSKKDLLTRPNNVATLAKLEDFYKKNNSLRMASYFTGRINSLKEQND